MCMDKPVRVEFSVGGLGVHQLRERIGYANWRRPVPVYNSGSK